MTKFNTCGRRSPQGQEVEALAGLVIQTPLEVFYSRFVRAVKSVSFSQMWKGTQKKERVPSTT